jgi:hypothetical protein
MAGQVIEPHFQLHLFVTYFQRPLEQIPYPKPLSDNVEAAIVMDLAPAAYTAVVRGKNNTTGVGLMEVYNLQ